MKRIITAMLAAVLATSVLAPTAGAAIDPPPAAMQRAELFKRQAKKEYVKAMSSPVLVAMGGSTGTLIYNAGDAKCYRGAQGWGENDITGGLKFMALFTIDWCTVGPNVVAGGKFECFSYEGTWVETEDCTYTKTSYGYPTRQFRADYGYKPVIYVPWISPVYDVDLLLTVGLKGSYGWTWHRNG